MIVYEGTPVIVKDQLKVVYLLVDREARIESSLIREPVLCNVTDRHGRRYEFLDADLQLAFPEGRRVTIVSTLNNVLLYSQDIGKKVVLEESIRCRGRAANAYDDECWALAKDDTGKEYQVLIWNVVLEDEVDPAILATNARPATFENLRALSELSTYSDSALAYIAWLVDSQHGKTVNLFDTIYDEILKMPQIWRNELKEQYLVRQIGTKESSKTGFISTHSGQVFLVDLALSKIRTWEVRSLDVWGNAEEGFEVNNSFKAGEIELNENSSYEEIIDQFIAEGWIRAEAKDQIEIDSSDTDLFTIQHKETGEPIFNVLLDEES